MKGRTRRARRPWSRGTSAAGTAAGDPQAEIRSLMRAVEGGHAQGVRRMLGRGIPVDASLEDGVTPLMVAVFAGRAEMVRALLEAGADVAAKRARGGDTALHLAAQADRPDLAAMLLEAGAPLEERGRLGETPFCAAAARGSAATAKALAKAGADVNAGDADGETPLMKSVGRWQPGMAQLLLDAGADVNARDASGWTALHHVTLNKCEDEAELLIRAGASLRAGNRQAGTPLMAAVRRGQYEIARLFLRVGADPETSMVTDGEEFITGRDAPGDPGGVAPALEERLRRPSDITAMAVTVYSDDTGFATLLWEFRADVNQAFSDGLTNLMVAARLGSEDMTETLLRMRADPNAREPGGQTPLGIATAHGHAEVAGMLRAAGAK